jgi:hypothetical protein
VLREVDDHEDVGVERAARLVEVEFLQRRVVRAAGRNEHVVDRLGNIGEEPVDRREIGRVEGGAARGADVGGGLLQALGVAAHNDHLGALFASGAGGREADSGAATEHDDGLAGQFRRAMRRRVGRCRHGLRSPC